MLLLAPTRFWLLAGLALCAACQPPVESHSTRVTPERRILPWMGGGAAQQEANPEPEKASHADSLQESPQEETPAQREVTDSPLLAVGAVNLSEVDFRQNQGRKRAAERARGLLGEAIQRAVEEVFTAWGSSTAELSSNQADAVASRLLARARMSGYRLEGTWVLATCRLDASSFEEELRTELQALPEDERKQLLITELSARVQSYRDQLEETSKPEAKSRP